MGLFLGSPCTCHSVSPGCPLLSLGIGTPLHAQEEQGHPWPHPHPVPSVQCGSYHESKPLTCCLGAPPDVDSGYYTVKFDSLLLKEAVVEGDSILPPLRTEPTGSSDSDNSDADDPSYARGVAAARGPRAGRWGGTALAGGKPRRQAWGAGPKPHRRRSPEGMGSHTSHGGRGRIGRDRHA